MPGAKVSRLSKGLGHLLRGVDQLLTYEEPDHRAIDSGRHKVGRTSTGTGCFVATGRAVAPVGGELAQALAASTVTRFWLPLPVSPLPSSTSKTSMVLVLLLPQQQRHGTPRRDANYPKGRPRCFGSLARENRITGW